MNAHKKRKTADGSAAQVAPRAASASRSPSPSGADEAESSRSALTKALSKAPVVAAHKPRPARKQVTTEKLESIKAAADKSAQSGVTFNIWYSKWSGGDSYDSAAINNRKSETRCDIAKDSGYTRGDINGGSYVCLFFARGCCPLGADCSYLHRLPPPVPLPEQGRDCFGRERHGDYRDDMGGVGSMQRVNRTLYVGRIAEEARVSGGGGANSGSGWREGGRPGKNPQSGSLMKRRHEELSPTEKVLWRHFSEWGEIERIRVLHGRGCGFVTYKIEANAQFAKEAMAHQSLDHDEVLNVRWATEDPNQAAQREHHRDMVREGVKQVAARMTEEQREAGEAIKRLEAESAEGKNGRRLRIEDIARGQRRSGADEGEVIDEEAEQRERLREQQADEEMQRLIEENARGWAEIEAEKQRTQQQSQQKAAPAPAAPAQAPPAAAKGLLSSDVLSGLQQLKSIGVAAPKAATGLGSLAAYGSDSEED